MTKCPPSSLTGKSLKVAAWYYQQFDADPTLDVPAEGFGGWKQGEVELPCNETALIVMHAWDTGKPGEFPGWRRCVDYHPRADAICRDVFPPLFKAWRDTGMALFHVVAGSRICKDHPGYLRAVKLAGPPPPAPERIPSTPGLEKLEAFRAKHAIIGDHNRPDVEAGFARLDFPENARPLPDEGIAECSHQLFALCREAGVNHLIYTGFAINWCLLQSPGGMLDMRRRGFMCSAIRQAVTGVEYKESARGERSKEDALWRVGHGFGFVFDDKAIIEAARNVARSA